MTKVATGHRRQRLADKRAGHDSAQEVPADWGFFGPDSVAYRVWLYPTSLALGFMRAVSVEFLDPHLTAAVLQTDQVIQRTRLRYDRTLQYFAAILYSDAETVLRFSDTLVKVHSRSHGEDQVTHSTFDANNPDSQLWIHMTAWHSILKAYEKFGPGKLTAAEEREYWADCAKAAEFQTVDPDAVPRSREAVRAYFADWRRKNTASEGAQLHYRFLVHGFRNVVREDAQWWARAIGRVSDFFTWRAVASTLPRWANKLGGVRYTWRDRLLMALIGNHIVRLGHRLVMVNPAVELAVVDFFSPLTLPILDPIIRNRAPINNKVWDVAEAREHFGHTALPVEQYAAYQEAHARGEGPKPYRPRHHDTIISFE